MNADWQTNPVPVTRRDRRPWGQYLLITVGLSFLVLIVLLPLVNVFYQAFSQGLAAYWAGISTPAARHAIFLSLVVTSIAIPINTVFGILIAWVLARHRLPGKALILGILDLPLAIPPTIAGLMMVLLYSHADGLFGPLLVATDIHIIFALPGIVLTTLFVTIPFVAREVLPVLQEVGRDEEEAAYTLGAGAWQTFWRVTFPGIRWGVLYGVILATARALGEFGAVSVVSGKLIMATNTLTLHIERAYIEYQTVAAFACASLLAMLAIATLLAQEILRQVGTPGQGLAEKFRSPAVEEESDTVA